MRLRSAPARAGAHWVQLGLRTFARQPALLCALYMSWCMALVLISNLLPLGALLSNLLLPAFWLTMLVAANRAALGGKPLMIMLLLPFGRPQRRGLLMLGTLYCAGVGLMLALSAFWDGGLFARDFLGLPAPGSAPPVLHGAEPQAMTALLASGYFQAMLFFACGMLLLGLPLWHAPALVFWHEVKPWKAMFFSVVACWHNFMALALYGLLWLALCMLAALVTGGVLAMLLSPAQMQGLGSTALLFVMLMLGCMFQTSVVFSFHDSFAAPPTSTSTS